MGSTNPPDVASSPPTVAASPHTMDISQQPGASVEDKIKAALKCSPVTLFVKPSCPFCIEARRTFDNLGVSYGVIDVTHATDVHATLKSVWKQTTVPYVFIRGELVGGCDQVKELQHSGKLTALLLAAGVAPQVPKKAAAETLEVTAAKVHDHTTATTKNNDPMVTVTTADQPIGRSVAADAALRDGQPRAVGTWFAFPDVVDDRVARWIGVFTFIVCLLVAIFYKRVPAHYVMLGLMVDFIVRFLGGGLFSPLGCLANLMVAIMEVFGSKPKWAAGVAKQFATACGIMFSALATLFYLCDVHLANGDLNIVGLSFTCAMGLAAALEGFLGFCVGCLFFQLGVKFGILPARSYETYTNSRSEQQATWDFINGRLHEAPPVIKVHRYDSANETCVDIHYKTKTDDHIKENFHPIKNVKITDFLMHLGLAGLACAWKAAHTSVLAPVPVWQALAIASAVWYFVWLVLYAIKMVMYMPKVRKEWQHNLSGNCFVLPLTCLVLFAYLVEYKTYTLAVVLFWIGAPASLALSFIKVGNWIADRKDIEHVNVAWMVMPVSNFIAALVGPLLNHNYVDAMQFWFGFAFLFWLLLFAVTFNRAILHMDEDDRLRSVMALWVAAPAIGACAYVSCFLPLNVSYARLGGDFIFLNLHWFSIGVFFVFLWCFIRPYFGRMRFDMSYWAAGFSSDALAFTCLYYHMLKPGDLSQGIAYAALAGASAINAMLFLNTLASILRLQIFTPDFRWGPLSFMKLTHEAIKGAGPRLLDATANVLTASKEENRDQLSATAAALHHQWDLLNMASNEHTRHEEEVIFKTYKEFFPLVTHEASMEHGVLHARTDELDVLMQQLATADGLQRLDLMEMKARIAEWWEMMLSHLRTEEDHVICMPRKHIPLDVHKQIVRRCWALSSAHTWSVLLPWILNNQPYLFMRVRFLKTLLWAMPERAQQMGVMVGTGVDAVQWKRITDELPELIPRGADGWTRFY